MEQFCVSDTTISFRFVSLFLQHSEKVNCLSIKELLQTGVPLLALSAASMALFFSILFFRVLSLTYFLAVFLLTYAVYGMDRLASLEDDEVSHPERTNFLRRSRSAFALSVIFAFLTSLVLAAFSSWMFVILLPVAPIVVIAYSGDLSQRLLGTRKPNVKQYFIVKDATIASGWALLLFTTSVFLRRSVLSEQWIFLMPLLMKLFVMAVAYDFKDIGSDRRGSVRSLPIVLGEHSTKLLLHFLNLFATIIILVLIFLGMVPFLSVVFVPAFIYQFIMIRKVHQGAPDWVYFVLCDLEQFFWLLFLGIGVLIIGLA
jgi:4-hydroxybenzoate polyprenyltransferase